MKAGNVLIFIRQCKLYDFIRNIVDSISLSFVPEQWKCIILIIVQGLVAKQLQECGRK